MTMSVTTVLTPVLPQLVTGLCAIFGAVIAGFGGIVLTQRYNAKQRDRDRASAAKTKVETVTQELIDASGALHLALLTYQPLYNTWQPKLVTLGSSFLEFMAGKQIGGLAIGAARGARIVVDANQRELTAVQDLQPAMLRVMAAATRASLLLPPGPVRDAALRLSEVATEAGRAYGQDNLWRRKKADADRKKADADLYTALRELMDAANSQLHPEPAAKRRWWPSRLTRRGRQAAALTAVVPEPRDAGHDTLPAAATPAALPAAPASGRRRGLRQ
jgi:hypothetical protein